MFRLLSFLITLSLVIFSCADDGEPIVETENGIMQGAYMETRKGSRFSAFMGIPYAKPPVGELRFKAPIPPEPWEGILDASAEHAVCPQRNIYTRTDLIEGDEDCLYLNVYTPKTSNFDNDLLAVMVFFHGGGYLCGGGNITWYAPHTLIDKNVILVVPNYRLGPLGFLSTGDEVCPGNNGLKDQNLALRWINKNIYNFGGNPDKVTIFGESAGGASVHFHMLSPLSKGLFSAGISQSGTALTTWTLAPKGEGINTARKLAKFLKCPTKSNVAMLKCLRKIDVYDLIEQDRNFMDWDFDPMIPFKPVIEPKVEGAFMTAHPIDIIKSGNVTDVPWITGINTDEGALRVAGIYGNPHLIDELNKDFQHVVPISLFYGKTASNPDYVTGQIKQFYFRSGKVDNSSKQQVIDMYSDAWFTHAADTAVRLHRNYFKSPVYYYLFGHRGQMSMSERFGDAVNNYGVCHADELQYIFDFGELSPNDNYVSKILVDLWTNFAKNGNPTDDDYNLTHEKWYPVKSDNMEYAYIGQNGILRMTEGLYSDRNEFWSSLELGLKYEIIRDEL